MLETIAIALTLAFCILTLVWAFAANAVSTRETPKPEYHENGTNVPLHSRAESL